MGRLGPRRGTSLLLSVAALGFAAGCSSSKSTPAATSGTGTPIVIGMLNEEKGAVTFTDWGNGIRAAVAYVNNTQHGVNNHPLHLVECLTDGTPDVSAACGTKFVSQHVVAVVDGADLTDETVHPILDQAGIPMTGAIPFSAADYASKTSYWTGVGPDYSMAIPVLAKQELNANSAVFLSPSTADQAGPDALIGSVAKAVGLNLKVVKYSLTDPSNYPAVAAQAIADKPDIVFMSAADAQATPLLTDLRQAGWTGALMSADSQQFSTALPAGEAKGIYALTAYWQWDAVSQAPAATQSQLTAFNSSMKQYFPSPAVDSFTQAGFSSLMNLVTVLGSVNGTIDAASIKSAFAQNVARPLYMGRTFDCATPPLPAISPGVCAKGVQLLQWTGTSWKENGTFLSGMSPS